MKIRIDSSLPGNQIGFTLIEIMIVVAIISILAAIAYPSYTESIRKSRRADCQGALIGLSAAMERHYTANGNYRAAAAGGADTGAPAIFPTQCPLDNNTKYYNLTINAVPSDSTYTLNAAPIGAQASDKCGTLTLTNTGVRDVTGADTGITSANCWQ